MRSMGRIFAMLLVAAVGCESQTVDMPSAGPPATTATPPNAATAGPRTPTAGSGQAETAGSMVVRDAESSDARRSPTPSVDASNDNLPSDPDDGSSDGDRAGPDGQSGAAGETDAPVGPMTGEAPGEGGPPSDDPHTADLAEVADPIFEGPWFPCPEEDYPEHVVVVKTHDKVVHTINSTQVDAEVDLPEGNFKAVALRVEHECPTGGTCDLYDRRAVYELIKPSDTGEQNIGLMRYITTYRFNSGQTNYMCSWTDVTPYASLLTGKQTLRSWLDTVVEPGHELGDGWQVSAELVFYPGPKPDPVQVHELYGKFINIGAAPDSIDAETPPSTVEIPPEATRVIAQLTVSGHGWGPENTDNCAEFCRLDQTISVNGGTPHVINPFRSDCGRNPLAPLQQRNPTGSRNGWCPGAVVLPHIIDITDEVIPGMPATIDLGVQRADGREYIDADPSGYNPNEYISLQLLISTPGPDD